MPDEVIEDVPSGIDLRTETDARTWAAEADQKRPWRAQVRRRFADLLLAETPRPRRVLELGSGPGLLSAEILAHGDVEQYTLFDFSPPMHAMARDRVGADARARFVLGDFKQAAWTAALDPPFDAVVSMQAVHEIRHKRHVPGLYRDVHMLLRPGGLLVVCDHNPMDDSWFHTNLASTEAEQHAAFRAAAFADVTTVLVIHGMYVIHGRRPA
jgi:SAM-dependent methyltransferase